MYPALIGGGAASLFLGLLVVPIWRTMIAPDKRRARSR
jgi:hypothetical protein